MLKQMVNGHKTDAEGDPYMDYIALWLDWVHFAGGRWKGRYRLDDSHASVQKYGRRTEEFFDKTAYSDEDCYYQAMYIVKKYRYPVRTLENVEIDYSGMESLSPGEIVNFDLPEGSFSLRIKKITWTWDGDLLGKLDLDNEGLQPEETTCENKLENPGFETGDFPPWTHSEEYIYITETPSDVHSGSYAVHFHGTEYYTPWLKQEITPVSGSSISELSFWAKGDSGGELIYLTIIYSDDSTDMTSFTVTSSYQLYDKTSYINQSKNVKGIKIEVGANDLVYVDDFTLEVCQ